MMKTRLICFFVLIVNVSPYLLHAQEKDSTKRLWAFPITDYTMKLNDSVTLVQVHLSGLPAIIKEKQMGVLYGVYQTQKTDADTKGYGRCNLIKEDYYYFTIKNTSAPKAGDLLYTSIPAKDLNKSPLALTASHGVRFTDVDGAEFYKPESFLNLRTNEEVEILMQRMITDIKKVGAYYLRADSSLNQLITSGAYKGKRLMQLLSTCSKNDLLSFLQYAVARPRLYAGREWKVSETFATWLVQGAPMIKEN